MIIYLYQGKGIDFGIWISNLICNETIPYIVFLSGIPMILLIGLIIDLLLPFLYKYDGIKETLIKFKIVKK